jgi:sugar/nucleoside kinase (ribokinase family)
MVKVLGMGNALVDIMTKLDGDQYLEQFRLPKGGMVLVDRRQSDKVLAGTEHLEKTITSGGSAANTIHGIANMGIETGYIGKIGHDDMGRFFYNDLIRSHINPRLFYSDTESGRAIALVSKDTERTFATYLGAAIELSDADLDESVFHGYDFFHIEGYIVQNHQLLEKAVKLAKKSGMRISLDLASYNVVEANRDFLEHIVKKYVNILFANEDEAKSFTGSTPEDALHQIAGLCDIAVVKTGKKGSLIQHGKSVHQIGVIDVQSVDTTGAGDLYASGFIYGLVNAMPLEKCGRAGAILAGKVIEVMGPKMDDQRWEDVKRMIAQLD